MRRIMRLAVLCRVAFLRLFELTIAAKKNNCRSFILWGKRELWVINLCITSQHLEGIKRYSVRHIFCLFREKNCVLWAVFVSCIFTVPYKRICFSHYDHSTIKCVSYQSHPPIKIKQKQNQSIICFHQMGQVAHKS